MAKVLAEYFRLSLDDDSIGESNSITNQRLLINEYVETVPELSNMPVKEFVDDGFSGTNFERPGVKALLEAVRKGEIGCIVVKDLSRFGRKYLEVSKYIEQIFPLLGIRFIAVNDHYDSNNHKGTTAEIDVPVRNMINALYSKDVSKKVKTAKQTQARQGKYINAFAPYGYKKDLADKHRIIIDEPAADVVRRIYSLTCDGKGPLQIAKTLNSEGVLTPMEYKKSNGSKHFSSSVTGSLWTINTVINILRNEQYTGTFIGGKVEMGELGSGKRIYKPKEDWIIIPNAHPAIVSKEIWDAAASMKTLSGGKRRNPNSDRALYKKVRCGYCGHTLKLRVSGENKKYKCETLKYSSEYGCQDQAYSEEIIVDVVKNVLMSQITVMLNMEKKCSDIKKAAKQSIKCTNTSIAQIDKEIGQLQAFKRQLYERYRGGSLDKERYFKEREALEYDINAKTELRNTQLAENEKQAGTINSAEQFLSTFLKYKETPEVSAKMINKLVEAVHIYSHDRIEVTFTFKDELAEVIPLLEKLGENKKI